MLPKTYPTYNKLYKCLPVRYPTTSNLETQTDMQMENVGNDLKANTVTIQMGRVRGKNLSWFILL